MKVMLGYEKKTYGTIEVAPDGFVYRGDTEQLKRTVDGIRGHELNSFTPLPVDTFPGGRAEFLRDLVRQTNNGYSWSRIVPEDEPTPFDNDEGVPARTDQPQSTWRILPI